MTLTATMLAVGCASHPPTKISSVSGPEARDIGSKTVDFVATPYYLGTLDDPSDTEISTWAHDQTLANQTVSQAILPYGSNVRLVTKGGGSAHYRSEIGIHTYVAWSEILYALLPVPHSSNESVCVTASLSKNGELLSTYSECGFSRERGFWAWTGGDHPRPTALRSFVTDKVIAQVMQGVADD